MIRFNPVFFLMLLSSLLLTGCMIQNDRYRVQPQDYTLHPESEAFRKSLKSPDTSAMVRAIDLAIGGDSTLLNQIRQKRNRVPDPDFSGLRVEDLLLPGNPPIPIRIYLPSGGAGRAKDVLVYFHGGGWTIGSIRSCARFCSEFARRNDLIVVAVDYRLAPEYPYPTPLNDCVNALIWVKRSIGAYGGNPDHLFVGGDSSGGNLAIGSALALYDREKIRLSGLLLFYPVVLARDGESSSWDAFGIGYGQDSASMSAFNRAYAPTAKENTAIYASPLLASSSDLKKLPRTLLISARCDILFDQGILFAEKLFDSGVPVTYLAFRGAIHLFITCPGQEHFYRRSLDEASKFLKEDALKK